MNREKIVLINTITIKPLISGNLQEFFQTKNGIFICKKFTERVQENNLIKPKDNSEIKVSSFKLLSQVSDDEIIPELPLNYPIELWSIAELINRQWNGEEGFLLVNEHVNFCYVKSVPHELVILFRRDLERKEWIIDAWFPNEFGRCWKIDRRVLSL